MAQASIDTATALRVLLVDRSRWVRQGIREALQRAGLTVVGEAADGVQALAQAATQRPDVVLMGLLLSGWTGSR
jgi:DNA-binding NarL/FixJ family response regulator